MFGTSKSRKANSAQEVYEIPQEENKMFASISEVAETQLDIDTRLALLYQHTDEVASC